MAYPLPRDRAVALVQLVANQNGISNPFDLFDAGMIEHKLNQLDEHLKSRSKALKPSDAWMQLVEEEFGIDPGDPHESREFEIYLRG